MLNYFIQVIWNYINDIKIIVQSVTCLAKDASLTADQGIASLIPVPFFLWSFSSLLLNQSRRVVVSNKRKYVHGVLFICLFKLAQEKVWLGELTGPQ